jgi:hypothetical protein
LVPLFLKTACRKTGLLGTSELDPGSSLFVNQVAKVKKGSLLVGEKVTAAIEGAVM